MGKKRNAGDEDNNEEQEVSPEKYLAGLVGRFAAGSDSNISLKRARKVLKNNSVGASKVGSSLRIEEFGLTLRFEGGNVVIGKEEDFASAMSIPVPHYDPNVEKSKRKSRKERREERQLVEAHYSLTDLVEFLPIGFKEAGLKRLQNPKNLIKHYWIGFPAIRIRDHVQELDDVIVKVLERYILLAEAEPKYFSISNEGKMVLIGPLPGGTTKTQREFANR